MNKSNLVQSRWFRAIYLAGISGYLYVFMEWVFFVTKTSFMSSMDLAHKIDTLLVACFVLTLPILILTAIILLGAHRFKFLLWVAAAIPASILASTSLILLDNFTYTVLNFGIVNSRGIWRGGYALLFLAAFIWFLKAMFTRLKPDQMRYPGAALYSFMLVMTASLVVFSSHLTQFNISTLRSTKGALNHSLPDIILLGLDGVDATHMSVYGYSRTTTPNIEALSRTALIAENAFSNSGATTGSLASILTGQLPTKTRVLYSPDILLGNDSYKHLPGLLKQMGYTTVQVTLPQYGDAYSINLRAGFDIANSRSLDGNALLGRIDRIGGGGGFYFITELLERIQERLDHIFYIKVMQNPYLMVTQPASNLSDEQRFDAMTSYIQESPRPLFLHVHMMITHGDKFDPRKNVYSMGETQDSSWMTDFYDDAILDSDQYVGKLFKLLEKRGRLQSTIVVLFSDHGMIWNPRERVPLIFWFPGGDFAGRLHNNAQLIDIAPTLLDYLGVGQPEWMQGKSILEGEPSPGRRIFSAELGNGLVVEGEEGFSVDETRTSPPFYQFGFMNLIVCDRWYRLNLKTPELSYDKVAGSSATCDPADIPSPESAKTLLLEQLKQDGFDVSAFPEVIPMSSP